MGNKRILGAASFGSTFEVGASGPLDARMLVDTYEDLLVSDSFPVPYLGMVVAVADSGKLYVLKNIDYTQASSWRQVGSGANTVVTSSTRKNAASYDEVFTGMMVTESDTGNVYVYKGSEFTPAAMDLDSNWSKVGDDSGSISTINSDIIQIHTDINSVTTDVANIANLNTVKANITSWTDSNNKITAGTLVTYNTANNTTADNQNPAIEIPYATTSAAGVMSSTDKNTLNTVSTFVSNYTADVAITNAEIDNIVNPSAQSGS